MAARHGRRAEFGRDRQKDRGNVSPGSKFNRLIQTRGQQGIGASGCILFSQMTTGKPIKAVSGNDGKPVYMEIGINVEKNEPIITNKKYFLI
jgi:DNA topoisomerase-6 subunit B